MDAPAEQATSPARTQGDRATTGSQTGAAAAPTGGAGGVDVETIRRVWPDVVGRLATMRRVTWMMVRDHATVASFDGRRLVLALGNPGVLANFRSGAHADFVQQALIDVLGVDAKVDVTGADAGDDVPPAHASSRPAPVGSAPDRDEPVEHQQSAAAASWDEPADDRADGAHAGSPGASAARGQHEQAEPEGWERPASAAVPPPSSVRPEAGASVGPGSGSSGAGADGREPNVATTTPGAVRRPLVDVADDEPSPDDVDAADSGLMGRAVVEQLLGGRVIDETGD